VAKEARGRARAAGAGYLDDRPVRRPKPERTGSRASTSEDRVAEARLSHNPFVRREPASTAPGAGAAVVALAAATVATLAVVLSPGLSFVYASASAAAALETAVTLVALLAAFLAAGRARDRRSVAVLLVAYAFAAMAGANATVGMLRAVASGDHFAATWAAVLIAPAIATVLAAAAWLPARELSPRAPTWWPLGAAAVLPAVLAVALSPVAGSLPRGLDLATHGGADPSLDAHPAILALRAAATVGYLAAAAGFVYRARHDLSPIASWLAVGCLFLGFSKLHAFLFPALSAHRLYVADLFRLAGAAAFLGGCAVEIVSYWRRLAAAAVLDERQRIARDLHDTVAQELAFIRRHAAQIHPSETRRRISDAAQRALIASRRSILALATAPEVAVDAALAAEASTVAGRFGADLDLRLEPGLVVDAARRDLLVRVACEAVANAARHGRAPTIRVELQREGTAVRLRVADEGRGFSPERTIAGDRGGFGLVSMRERVSAVGGSFRLTSAPGEGTEIDVVV